MEHQERGLTVNIENYSGEKPIVIEYREGSASRPVQPLETKAPEKVDITGIISTPFDWLAKRITEIDQKLSNVVVNREKMSITLTVNENDYYKKGTIKGVVEFSELFDKFGINKSDKGWLPAKLGQFLRLNRGVFTNSEECMKLVSLLKNFTAKANSEIQKQTDPSGSRAEIFRQNVESNLPKSFTVDVAIFKGTAKTPISVEFDHYVSDGDVMLQLVSPGANEVMESYRDKCLDEVLNKIREIAPEIAILEV